MEKISKRDYVEKFLSPAAVAADAGVVSVEYVTHLHRIFDDDGVLHYCEELVVTYEWGRKKVVNVEADSLSGMFYDFAKHIF